MPLEAGFGLHLRATQNPRAGVYHRSSQGLSATFAGHGFLFSEETLPARVDDATALVMERLPNRALSFPMGCDI